MKKVIAVAAVMAMTGLVSTAGAADRLTVKNSSDAVVFKVDDTGSLTAGVFSVDTVGKRVGSGLSTGHAAEASLHVVDITNSPNRGGIFGQHDGSNAAANVIFRKSRGDDTDAGRAAVLNGDYVASFHGNAFTGTSYVTTATINMFVDGPVATNGAPMSLMFMTGSTGGNKKDRFRVTATGNVVIANNGGSATADLTTTATAGMMYIPKVAGTYAACGTAVTLPDGVTQSTVGQQYTGHAPVWIDSTGNKICTCNGTALKCASLI